MKMWIAFSLVLYILSASVVFAEEKKEKQKPCSGTKFHEFDFWLGEWNVTRVGNPESAPAKSKISRMNDCVILEEYEASSGYSGKSFNLLDSSTNEWQQFWVDNEGGYLYFTGHFENGVLQFMSKGLDENRKPKWTRMLFSKLEGNKVRQYIEESQDNGMTWTKAFEGIYSRR